MYEIYNKAFDNIYKKYKTKLLESLGADELVDICYEMKVSPIWKERNVLNKIETVRALLKSYSVDMYMGEPYWTEEHRNLDREIGLLDQLKQAEDGNDTFQMMARYGFGVAGLEPGDKAKVKWTHRFIDEFYSKTAQSHITVLKNLETNKEVSSNTMQDKDIKSDLLKDDIEKVKRLARKYGIKTTGKDQVELVDLVVKAMHDGKAE